MDPTLIKQDPGRLHRFVSRPGHRPFEILSECHILGLLRRVLQADLWYVDGVPCVGHSDGLSDGGRGTTLPRFWKRYVDDTCTALHPDQLPAFHRHLNSIEASIQFTLEPDENGKLAFLDTVIAHHPDGSLSTTVHRKATHTDKYLDF